jgi:hypothetical protein
MDPIIHFFESHPFAVGLIGGAVAATLIRIISKLIAKIWYSKMAVAVYLPSDFVNVATDGRISVQQCKLVDDDNAGSKKCQLFEGDEAATTFGEGHIIYGPYSNDFGRSGHYRVSFYIRATGFESSETVVLRLEVAEGTRHYQVDWNSPHLPVKSAYVGQVIVGRKIIRSKDLKVRLNQQQQPIYRRYDVIVHSSGAGIFEYRCKVENFDPQKQSLRFERITVHQFLPGIEVFT